MLKLHDNEPTRTPEADPRVSAMLARLHGEPLYVTDARDVIVCIEGEPPIVITHACAYFPLAILGGPEFAAWLEQVPRKVGEIVVVLCIGEAVVDVRTIGLRKLQRGGSA